MHCISPLKQDRADNGIRCVDKVNKLEMHKLGDGQNVSDHFV